MLSDMLVTHEILNIERNVEWLQFAYFSFASLRGFSQSMHIIISFSHMCSWFLHVSHSHIPFSLMYSNSPPASSGATVSHLQHALR